MTFSSLLFCTAPCETDVCTCSQHTPCRTKTDARGEVSARGEETGLEPKWGYSVRPSSFPPPSVPSFLHFSPISLPALALLLLHPTPAPLEVDPVRLAAGQGFSGKRQTACANTPPYSRGSLSNTATEEAPQRRPPETVLATVLHPRLVSRFAGGDCDQAASRQQKGKLPAASQHSREVPTPLARGQSPLTNLLTRLG